MSASTAEPLLFDKRLSGQVRSRPGSTQPDPMRELRWAPTPTWTLVVTPIVKSAEAQRGALPWSTHAALGPSVLPCRATRSEHPPICPQASSSPTLATRMEHKPDPRRRGACSKALNSPLVREQTLGEAMEIPILPVRQWLRDWSEFSFNEDERQSRPPETFYVGAMSAGLLARLANVYPRTEENLQRAQDTGVQRAHVKDRTQRIRNYLRGGYPWADLPERRRDEFAHLRKPGWLPTAVILNISGDTAKRNGRNVAEADRVVIASQQDGAFYQLVIPEEAAEPDWTPREHAPIEIIDGQHRVFAFIEDGGLAEEELAEFELPIVCFFDLDLSWEAYLFWSVNITPKKIGPSLAFDLFPLLRTQSWLDVDIPDAPAVYRESRAQELTEALWASQESPWYQRIAMLGRSRGMVTQAAWVRSLSLSLLRNRGRGELPAGFFSSGFVGPTGEPLPWKRAQQAAYLIVSWQTLLDEIVTEDPEWLQSLRGGNSAQGVDTALGRYSLLSTDQGVRGYLQVLNDLSARFADRVPFAEWRRPELTDQIDLEELRDVASDLQTKQEEIVGFLRRIGKGLTTFDWRTAGFPGLTEDEESRQSRFRAGTGYKELHRQLLLHLSEGADTELGGESQALASIRWPEAED